ncbi:hypothetical protein T440DRAFT_247780 [Plenodomus tracheiphilus IPT5]|uniref:Uncharacterized protein n=1 Tax=Plenodomus tracheiphilus IPT5 TaxID=1408161 RepID=A0A6A7ASN2_9PLEO|nr:hypothetical protein T440DRAFT_247780 [Plenodomus tracheiphilus IPT5]
MSYLRRQEEGYSRAFSTYKSPSNFHFLERSIIKHRIYITLCSRVHISLYSETAASPHTLRGKTITRYDMRQLQSAGSICISDKVSSMENSRFTRRPQNLQTPLLIPPKVIAPILHNNDESTRIVPSTRCPSASTRPLAEYDTKLRARSWIPNEGERSLEVFVNRRPAFGHGAGCCCRYRERSGGEHLH